MARNHGICEAHYNVNAPGCPICMAKQIDVLVGALGQASMYIRWYGPKGGDKDFTMRVINHALGKEKP